MFYQLPPVGNPVYLDGSIALSDIAVLSAYQTQFYSSGTAALAATIVAAIEIAKKSQNIDNAEIILPAYGCPDLVSAVVFAGAKPILVDFEADRPWLDLSVVNTAITENTAAIVAVNLFGITERWQQLREIADKNDVILIEDSAQYFPTIKESSAWHGDLVVLSFGRGKPVSLLGGGAVLTKNKALYECLPRPKMGALTLSQRLTFSLKARLYNVMISPFLYWLPQALPFLHLGETRYHALLGVEAMQPACFNVLADNIARYQNDAEAVVRCEKISTMLDAFESINNLPQDCNIGENHRLLRYPLLVDASFREIVFEELKQAGLGVSIMYPDILVNIEGMEFLQADNQVFPNAEAFTSRLITLPTHSSLNQNNIQIIKAILKRTVR